MTEIRTSRQNRTEVLQSSIDLEPVKIEAAPLRQKIVSALRRAIELGTLKAGDRLIEKDLCAKLNVSRTSLREALRDLEANGIITNLSVRGLVVSTLSRDDIVGIFHVRQAIETLVAEQFIKCGTAGDITELQIAFERIRVAVSSVTETLDAHRYFYEVWCKGARNNFAYELLMNIQLRLSTVRSGALTAEHLYRNTDIREEILNCSIKRDIAGVRAAVRRLVQFSANAYLGGAGMLPLKGANESVDEEELG